MLDLGFGKGGASISSIPNTSLFGAGFWVLLLLKDGARLTKPDLIWLAPPWLILLSFSLFENPWLKTISLLILPIATGFLYTFRRTPDCDAIYWRSGLIKHLLRNSLAPLSWAGRSTQTLLLLFSNLSGGADNTLVRRILIGLAILMPLAIIVIVLLSSADAQFLRFVDSMLASIWENLNLTILFKLSCIVATTVLILAMICAWQGTNEYEDDNNEHRKLDDVVAGVVILGILLIYMAFLYFQFQYMAVDQLPIDFSQTEKLVKSGFWQLFFLSILNAIMFFFIYKNTASYVQFLLRAFILASGLVLLSGCWRMGLYVYWYGLNYEKFFASYTAIFSLFIFVYLVIASFRVKRENIYRFIAPSSLWFYSLAAVMPIEKIVFNTNIHLSQRSDSRIDLYHLTALSVDVFSDVKVAVENGDVDMYEWRGWLANVHRRECSGEWYEANLSRVINCKN